MSRYSLGLVVGWYDSCMVCTRSVVSQWIGGGVSGSAFVQMGGWIKAQGTVSSGRGRTRRDFEPVNGRRGGGRSFSHGSGTTQSSAPMPQ